MDAYLARFRERLDDRVDELTEPGGDQSVYQLARSEEGDLVLSDREGPLGRPVELDADGMQRLIDAVDARNEMRRRRLVLPGGEEIAFEEDDEPGQAPQAIVVEDSRGLLRISIAGLIEAKPPLDDAVKSDLLEVFRDVLVPGQAAAN